MIHLACDASSYGIRAVLSHKMSDGSEKLGFVSRTLTDAEKKYSVIEKEGLACVHSYLFGHRFKLHSSIKAKQFRLKHQAGSYIGHWL